MRNGFRFWAARPSLDIPEYAATTLVIVADPDGTPVELMSPAFEEDVIRWATP